MTYRKIDIQKKKFVQDAVMGLDRKGMIDYAVKKSLCMEKNSYDRILQSHLISCTDDFGQRFLFLQYRRLRRETALFVYRKGWDCFCL